MQPTQLISLVLAALMGWTALILAYEIPCALGKHTRLDWPVVKAALKAEARVKMKYRTQSVALDRLIHELEEVKEFYAQI